MRPKFLFRKGGFIPGASFAPRNFPGRITLCLLGLILMFGCYSVRAQWLTQSIIIKPGWTAVYLNVDASGYGEDIDQLVGNDPANPIAEIWWWRAAITPAQYVTTPEAPLSAGSHWITWLRNSSATPNGLELLIPNSAYLMKYSAFGATPPILLRRHAHSYGRFSIIVTTIRLY